jgi:hypothetical protein
MGAPVDDALAAVDQSFVVIGIKDFRDRIRQAFVHREALALPVTGRTESLQLFDDPASVEFAPFPGTLEEFVAADSVLCEASFFIASTILASVAIAA